MSAALEFEHRGNRHVVVRLAGARVGDCYFNDLEGWSYRDWETGQFSPPMADLDELKEQLNVGE